MTADLDLTRSDVDTLWSALLAAKADGDQQLVRRIENRMRELRAERRFAHLSDAELDAAIAAVNGNRAPTGLLAYSPGGLGGGDNGVADLPALNRVIAAGQHAGIEETYTALREEHDRRTTAAA